MMPPSLEVVQLSVIPRIFPSGKKEDVRAITKAIFSQTYSIVISFCYNFKTIGNAG